MKKATPKPLTISPSQVEFVTLAVYLIGGDEKRVDTEDVAMKAHELAPTRFAWRKYPQQINLELIRVYLSDAKSIEKGGYIDGSGKTGWTLTPRGLRWARGAEKQLLASNLDRTREQARGGPLREQRWRRERDRILASPLWARWSSGSRDMPVRDAEAVFRIDSYAVGRLRTQKIERLRTLFEDDKEILSFVEHLAELVQPCGSE